MVYSDTLDIDYLLYIVTGRSRCIWRRRTSALRWPVKAQLRRRLGTASLDVLKAGVGSIRKAGTPGVLSDPDVVLYATWTSVWGRWFVWAVGLFLILYRPNFWYPEAVEYLAIPVLLGLVNGLLHWRLLRHRAVSWRWLLVLSATDVSLTTFGIVVGGGFPSFIFLAYYPALAVLAVVFSSFWLILAWTTTVAVVYVVVCLQGGRRSGHRHGQGKGAGGETSGHVCLGARCELHHPIRASPVAGGRIKGAATAAGTYRTLADDSQYDRADGLHDRPGNSQSQGAGR